MDDVDAAEAMQAKNMLLSGDWVTGRLDGVAYLDKAPLKYWITASLYKVFGIHDWVARLPTAIAAILLCWLVMRTASWAISREAGFYAGLVMATSLGLFLFTRTVIPDVILTLLIACALYSFLRLQESRRHSFAWAMGMYAAMALAVLTKGFVGVIFPAGIVLAYLIAARKLLDRDTWRRLHIVPGILVFLAIAAPWHILATLRNPPYFSLNFHAGPHFGGRYRGFFWFYFINEQVLRFLNERWPRDYNTVPRVWFWASTLVWFFPWSMAAPGALRLNFKPTDRAGRVRLFALCWIGVVMLFFTFSTTQEYYSMPIYPAVAILLGSVMATRTKWTQAAMRISAVVAALGFLATSAVLILVRNMPAPGDISAALHQHPGLYRLSLGHMADLTLPAFGYLKTPLALAALACFLGAAAWKLRGMRAVFATAAMLVLFFQAARLALVAFDPYMSSYPIAAALNHSPQGTLVVNGEYNGWSSVFFYTRDSGLILNGRYFILEYGSYEPGAPKVFIEDEDIKQLWSQNRRFYLLTKARDLPHLQGILGAQDLHLICESGDKLLFSNQGNSGA
jgi:Dolichyl-phosphate-mannose-protein mannosyltransferase